MARQRGNRWQADVEIDGKRQRKSFATQEEAEAYERAVEKGLPAATSVTFGPFIDEHKVYLWGKGKAPEASYLNCRVLLRYIPAETLLKDINTRMVMSLIQRMEADGSSSGTINRKLSTLSKLLRLAERLEIIDKRPTIDFQREGEGRDRVLSKSEENKAIEFFDHNGLDLSSAFFKFLLYTGCRSGEARKVRREDVGDGYVTFRDTKNGTSRSVRLVGPAATAWAYVAETYTAAAPFSMLPKETFRGHWDRLRTHLGVEDDVCFVPHALRHTCCTRLVKAGIPLPLVMKWMGHKNIQTTMRYANLVPKDLDKAAEALMEAAE